MGRLGGRFTAKLLFYGWKTKKRQKWEGFLAGDLENLAGDWAGWREISCQLAGGGHAGRNWHFSNDGVKI
jgi:hypothetical protein